MSISVSHITLHYTHNQYYVNIMLYSLPTTGSLRLTSVFVLVVHPRQLILTTKHGVSVGPGLSTVKTSAQVRVLHNATGIATKTLIAAFL